MFILSSKYEKRHSLLESRKKLFEQHDTELKKGTFPYYTEQMATYNM